MGIGVAIVQFQNLKKIDFEGLLGFSFILATGLTLIYGLSAYPISLFYSDSGLIPLFLASAPTLFFSALNMVPNGLILREKRFKEIGIRLVITTLISGILAVIGAYKGMGAYVLILQTVSAAFLVFIWNYIASDVHKFSFHFMKPLRLIFTYSSFQFGFSTINYFARNLDNLLIGKFFGDIPLGYYDKAYKLTTYPLSSFSSVISSVVQPFMAKYQERKEIIWEFFIKVMKLVSLVGAAVTAILVTSFKEVILLFYGPQWNNSIPLFVALSVSIYTQMLGNISGAFFQSIGRTNLMFWCGLINTSTTILMLVLGISSKNMTIVAVCIAVAYIIQIFITYYMLINRGFSEKVLPIYIKLLPEIITAIIAICLGTFLGFFLHANLFITLLIKTVIVIIVLLIGYAATGQLKYFKYIFKKIFKNKGTFMHISFVILHYLLADKTLRLVDSLLSLSKSDTDVIDIVIVDNNSDNGSFELIQNQLHDNPNIYLIHNDRNLGFARGNNVGYEYAREILHANVIAILNNDLVIRQNDFLVHLKKTVTTILMS